MEHHFLYKDRFVEDPERGTILIQYGDNTTISAEEIVAMILRFAKETAQNYLHAPVSDCVITVSKLINLLLGCMVLTFLLYFPRFLLIGQQKSAWH